MIKIDKGSQPKFLSTHTVDLAQEKMEEFYKSKNRGQKRYDFQFNKEIDLELKKILHERFHAKCGYCESRIDSIDKGVVDRFRPYDGVRDKDEYYSDLYWWLNFEWSNLIYSCKECHQFKANYFPISGTRSQSEKDSLEGEEMLLINPTVEDPNNHFFFSDTGEIFSNTDRGFQTIELIRLDRTNLRSRRFETKIGLTNIIQKYIDYGEKTLSKRDIEYLKNIYDQHSTVEFLSYAHSILIDEIEDFPSLLKLLGEDSSESKQLEKGVSRIKKNNELEKVEDYNEEGFVKNDFFPIEYIEIENFKGISELKINFKEDPINRKSWLVLLGENGVGKSSILQAIAIGLNAKNKWLDRELIRGLIKKKEPKAVLRIKERNSSNIIETILTRRGGTIEQIGMFDSFVIGYGSLRLSSDIVKNNSKRDLDKISFENLFKPIRALNDITTWVKKAFKDDPDLFDRVAYCIKQLLPDDFKENELTVEGGKMMFKSSEKSFAELSDGFKSTIILAVDIMMKLSSAHSDMDKMTGIVLIDELGNQLHPRWQMRIVEQLRTVFKNINFIISTHHPLCLRGAERDEIILLRNVEKEIVAINELPDPAAMRVDQILASEFFGLSSLLDPEMEAKFNQYYGLLGKGSDISDQDRKKLDIFKDELRNKKQLGSSLREELMYTVIDKLLAEKLMYNKDSISREDLKEEAVKRVSEIWTRLNVSADD